MRRGNEGVRRGAVSFCEFEERYVGLSVWIFFSFVFAVETSLGRVDYDDGNGGVLETVSICK